MSDYLDGDLVENGDLDRVAKEKAKSEIEVTVDKPLPLKFNDENWKVKREFIKTVRIYKNKTPDELFEDEIWLLFYKMGFKVMNKDRRLRAGKGVNQRQIDIFAKDDSHIILIECKTAEKSTTKDLSKDIHEILNTKEETIDSLRNYFGREEQYKYIFFLITKNIILPKSNLALAEQNISKDFILWTEKETQPYRTMAEQYKDHARVIMYASIFKGRKKILETIEVPAIRGGKGDNKYYYFVIQPEKLLNGIAYIHRRQESNLGEISETYQRMLNKTKLESIKEYIQDGGYFANNIIMNFTDEPLFEPRDKIGDIVLGTLTLPRQYGSAWIIDGQHRLYGYLDSGKSNDSHVPVLAFDNMSVRDQAQLFVDINKEQTPVSAGLLWDLYSDLYQGSFDMKQQELRAISIIVKRLNSDSNSPLYKLIQLPSQSKDIQKKAHLALSRICVAVHENRLIKERENLLFEDNYEKTINNAYEVIKEYFLTISKSFPEDWEKREKGLSCSGSGIRIHLNILRQLLIYLNFREGRDIYLTLNKSRFNKKLLEILNPVIDKIRSMTPEERNKISRETSREKIVENTQRLLWDLKEETNFGIELWKKGGWTPGVPENESDANIKDMVDETEKELKSFIIQELKLLYGEEWWKIGIPLETKEYIENVLRKDYAKFPYNKSKLEALPEEEKLRFASTSHLKDLIIKRDNWVQFKKYFAQDVGIITAAFSFYESIRNKYSHPERVQDLGEIEKGLGYWNMKWIRRCIGLDKQSRV